MKKLFFVWLLFGQIVGQTAAIAETTLEKQYLSKILEEINWIHVLIEKAENQQKKEERIQEQFRYDWLKNDLKKIAGGIKEKLTLPTIQPRDYTLLKGNYLGETG